MISAVLSTLALTFSPALTPPADLDYSGLAREYVEELKIDEAQASSFDSILNSEHFLRLDFGAFDIRLPSEAASDKSEAKVFLQSLEDILELQRVWAEWTIHDPEDLERLRDAIELLQKKFVKKLSAAKFKKAAREDGANIFEQLGISEEVVDAEATVRELLGARRKLADGKVTEPLPAQLVLVPSREQYIKLASFIGKVQSNRRGQIWHPSMAQGTSFWGNDSQVVALEWAPWPYTPDRALAQGQSMNLYEKTGQREHVVDRAAASLLWNYFYYVTVPELETALSMSLVVDVIGQNSLTGNVKSFEWSRAGSTTEPYTRFVPGGNPSGGTLPPREAQAGPTTSWGTEEAIWEQTRAKDMFLKALQTSQKHGAKMGIKKDELDDARRRSKIAHFAVTGETSSDRYAVTAPFLGEEAEDAPIPPLEYLDDYEDFFRCYRTNFFFWLRTEGAGDESAVKFAKLMEASAIREAARTFDQLVEEIYGVELANIDPEKDTLEWRYLAWLAD